MNNNNKLLQAMQQTQGFYCCKYNISNSWLLTTLPKMYLLLFVILHTLFKALSSKLNGL